MTHLGTESTTEGLQAWCTLLDQSDLDVLKIAEIWGEFWKIQEISSLMRPETFYFYQKMPEI